MSERYDVRSLPGGWRQIVTIVRQEWLDALHSRRALAVIVLYLLVGVLSMNGFMTLLQRLETELAEVLQLQLPDQPGGLTHALWRSDRFRRMVERAVGSSSLASELMGTSPIALAHAGLAFFYAPLLMALIAPARIAEEIGGGSVRLMLLRTTRLRWSIGKLLGQALLMGLSLALGAVGAWVLACIRMPSADRLALLPAMLVWSMRAGIYAFAFLGLVTGVGQLTRSPARATLLAILAMGAIGILYWVSTRFAAETGWRALLDTVRQLTPQGHRMGMWRRSPSDWLPAAATLIALGLSFHLLGYAVWRRRDA